jgi:hypothetical protein
LVGQQREGILERFCGACPPCRPDISDSEGPRSGKNSIGFETTVGASEWNEADAAVKAHSWSRSEKPGCASSSSSSRVLVLVLVLECHPEIEDEAP